MRVNYSTNGKAGTQLSFDNDFFQAKFKRLSGTFSTERLGPCIRAGFFYRLGAARHNAARLAGRTGQESVHRGHIGRKTSFNQTKTVHSDSDTLMIIFSHMAMNRD